MERSPKHTEKRKKSRDDMKDFAIERFLCPLKTVGVPEAVPGTAGG